MFPWFFCDSPSRMGRGHHCLNENKLLWVPQTTTSHHTQPHGQTVATRWPRLWCQRLVPCREPSLTPGQAPPWHRVAQHPPSREQTVQVQAFGCVSPLAPHGVAMTVRHNNYYFQYVLLGFQYKGLKCSEGWAFFFFFLQPTGINSMKQKGMWHLRGGSLLGWLSMFAYSKGSQNWFGLVHAAFGECLSSKLPKQQLGFVSGGVVSLQKRAQEQPSISVPWVMEKKDLWARLRHTVGIESPDSGIYSVNSWDPKKCLACNCWKHSLASDHMHAMLFTPAIISLAKPFVE